MFQYRLDLPLALLVSPGVPDPSQHTRPLAVAVRPPLTMDTLVITSGNRPSAAHAQVPIVDQQTSHDGWTVGIAVISSSDSKVWLAHPLVYRRLLFEIPLPTSAAQVADTIAYIYGPTKPSKGEEIWTSDLLKGQSHRFELALLNALARFGIHVLFSGQFQQTQPVNNIKGASTSRQATGTMTSTKQPKASGPATSGFDLIALDPRHKRAVLISAKGITRSPGDDDIENLVVGVERVSRMLEGWQVSGLIACHASATRLVRVRQRDDIVVWGQEELAMLLTADTPDPIYRMLWTPPGWQRLDFFRGHLY